MDRARTCYGRSNGSEFQKHGQGRAKQVCHPNVDCIFIRQRRSGFARTLLRHVQRRFFRAGAGVAQSQPRRKRGFRDGLHDGLCVRFVNERRKQIAREARATLLGDVMDFPFPDACTAWGNPDAGPAFRAAAKSSVPTLFISGTLDVRTPPTNADEVRKGFPNSIHLIIDGAVHSDPLFLSSPQNKDVMLEFMKGQKISTTNIKLEPLKFAPLNPPKQSSPALRQDLQGH